MVEIDKIDTEKINKDTQFIGHASPFEIVAMMNAEDKKVAIAVEQELTNIAKIIEEAYLALLRGGRMIYLGAGNSGRLAVSDACECIPTFRVPENTVVALLSGGSKALVQADEGAEDNEESAMEDMRNIEVTKNDILIGLSASGRTPYVIGGLKYGLELGCTCVSISCSQNAEISQYAKIALELKTGPEAITGSTRLKAGTAQKMVLNMISTGTMIQMGKVYENYMVDVSIKNKKLYSRAIKIITDITKVEEATAEQFLQEGQGHVKNAVLMIMKHMSYEESQIVLFEQPRLSKLI